MKQIDWIEEAEEKKKRQEEFKLKHWRDQEGRLRYSSGGYQKIYYEVATSGASTPSYKVYWVSDTTA